MRPVFTVLISALLVCAGASQARSAPRKDPRAAKTRVAAAQTLVRMLSDRDASVRHSAFMALLQSGAVEAVPSLVPLLRSNDSAQARMAIQVLATIKSREAVLELIRVADERKGETEVLVAQSLGGSPPAMDELHAFYDRLAKSDDKDRRILAAVALSNMLMANRSNAAVSPSAGFAGGESRF
jgi:HEAT repeat protein